MSHVFIIYTCTMCILQSQMIEVSRLWIKLCSCHKTIKKILISLSAVQVYRRYVIDSVRAVQFILDHSSCLITTKLHDCFIFVSPVLQRLTHWDNFSVLSLFICLSACLSHFFLCWLHISWHTLLLNSDCIKKTVEQFMIGCKKGLPFISESYSASQECSACCV